MVKKSKNSIIKKAKKLERQGKYKKALKVCDDYLAEDLDLNILEIKMDLINNTYFSDEFLEKINKYQNTLICFLSEQEEEKLLKLYSATKNKMDFYTQSYDNSYLIGGLILDNLESILILNILTKENNSENSTNVTTSIPADLTIFKKDIEKTAKQYLSLDGTNLEKLLDKETANINKTKHEIKELTRFISNKNDSEVEENKHPEKNERTETTVKKLLNKINQSINEENYQQALEYVNEALITDNENIKVLELKVRILNHMQRFEEALATQKLLVTIAKNLKENITDTPKKDNTQTNLFSF
ncbi:MAG: hypothetical protein Q4P14_05015 [Methanobacteriaceae archaeon]|nr:hypothetical protein [Methanobacteriaceae archaeon]